MANKLVSEIWLHPHIAHLLAARRLTMAKDMLSLPEVELIVLLDAGILTEFACPPCHPGEGRLVPPDALPPRQGWKGAGHAGAWDLVTVASTTYMGMNVLDVVEPCTELILGNLQNEEAKGCKCPPGFKGDGVHRCEDIDECKERFFCQCKDCSCENTWGSHECGCGGNNMLYMREHGTCISDLPNLLYMQYPQEA